MKKRTSLKLNPPTDIAVSNAALKAIFQPPAAVEGFNDEAMLTYTQTLAIQVMRGDSLDAAMAKAICAGKLLMIDTGTIEKAVSEHYSAKLNGEVRCSYFEDENRYCIWGQGLPPHPDLAHLYPQGWSMMDYLSPKGARQIAIDAILAQQSH